MGRVRHSLALWRIIRQIPLHRTSGGKTSDFVVTCRESTAKTLPNGPATRVTLNLGNVKRAFTPVGAFTSNLLGSVSHVCLQRTAEVSHLFPEFPLSHRISDRRILCGNGHHSGLRRQFFQTIDVALCRGFAPQVIAVAALA